MCVWTAAAAGFVGARAGCCACVCARASVHHAWRALLQRQQHWCPPPPRARTIGWGGVGCACAHPHVLPQRAVGFRARRRRQARVLRSGLRWPLPAQHPGLTRHTGAMARLHASGCMCMPPTHTGLCTSPACMQAISARSRRCVRHGNIQLPCSLRCVCLFMERTAGRCMSVGVWRQLHVRWQRAATTPQNTCNHAAAVAASVNHCPCGGLCVLRCCVAAVKGPGCMRWGRSGARHTGCRSDHVRTVATTVGAGLGSAVETQHTDPGCTPVLHNRCRLRARGAATPGARAAASSPRRGGHRPAHAKLEHL
jgi:hypothetical protein